MRLMFFIALLFFIFFSQAHAQEKEFSYAAFETLPVLHDGRVKPLGSFARIYLAKFSGQETLQGKPAISWLAETVFDPASAASQPVFKIRNAAILELEEKETSLYSFEEVSAALKEKSDIIRQLLNTSEEDWSDDQRTFMEIHEYSILYLQLLRSLSAILPLAVHIPDELAENWDLENKTDHSFLDVYPHKEELDKRITGIISRKGDNPELYTGLEQQIVTLGFHLDLLERNARHNVLFRIVPGGGPDEWASPWAYLRENENAPVNHDYLNLWQNMAGAYRNDDIKSFSVLTSTALETFKSRSDNNNFSTKLKAEVLYNQFNLLTVAMAIYILALVFSCLHQTLQKPLLFKLAAASLCLGILPHLLDILLRVYILDRPPVGTLYESVIFVSLICAIGALFFEKKTKNGLSILTGALVAASLIAISKAFSIGDNLEVLIAVLNTNFWLATHVLCITIGYGWCVLAGTSAHFYLLQKCRHPDGHRVQNLLGHIKTLALLGLLFTTVGTILGGIWADQSWGRFWGWDPKENGALLIVLWLIWLLHGRIAGQIRPLTFAAGMAFTNVIVALAWFGVNLLNTGLHSYGFISGVAHALALFCAAEIVIIGSLWFLAIRKNRYAQP